MSYTVMVALDGSLLAERALRPALDLARLQDGKILLVRVLPTVVSIAQDKDLLRFTPTADDRQQVHDYLERQAALLRQAGCEVEVLPKEGSVALELASLSDQVDLLLMTSHGRSGFERLLLGSVTEEVVRRADLPVMVLRSQPVRLAQFKRILVPLDGTSLAARALPTAYQMARLTGATVVFCRVTYADLDPDHPERQREEAEARDYLAHIQETTPDDIQSENLTWASSIPRGILHLAQHHNIDLVVMATHQRSGLARAWWGSVAENVVRGSLCPVLLVPAS